MQNSDLDFEDTNKRPTRPLGITVLCAYIVLSTLFSLFALVSQGMSSTFSVFPEMGIAIMLLTVFMAFINLVGVLFLFKMSRIGYYIIMTVYLLNFLLSALTLDIIGMFIGGVVLIYLEHYKESFE